MMNEYPLIEPFDDTELIIDELPPAFEDLAGAERFIDEERQSS